MALRTWGRVTNPDGTKTWVEVTTDKNGYNDMVYLTALCQTIRLQTGESPFYATWGIDARGSLMSQIFPDYYIYQIQQQYAPHFASLKITPQSNIDIHGTSTPTYKVDVIFQSGASLSVVVPT